MIAARDLSKTYIAGARPALSGVSFQAHPGEVLGFLGQNGAGKTTTLRILAGVLRPSSGSASICGHDVVDDSLAARACLGYLPEQVPLYPELRVGEYLRYRAELRGVPRARRADAIAAAVARVGLLGQERRVIGQLSKGFRQRVGLCDALLHDPPALVLDEPTDGLDPNQRREVLALIGALSKDRAVVLCTHVLPEVEALCQRLLILDKGRVLAAGTPAEIGQRLVRRGVIELSLRGPRAELVAALAAVPGVATVAGLEVGEARAPRGAGEGAKGEGATPDDDGAGVYAARVELREGADEDATCEALARAALSAGELRSLSIARSSLEAVFRGLTQAPEA